MEDRYWLIIVVGVFILAMFLYASWNDARHHHRWGKWGDPMIVPARQRSILEPTRYVDYDVLLQRRNCETCGELQQRRVNDP